MSQAERRRARYEASFTHRAASLPGAHAFGRLHAWVYRHTRGRLGRRWFGTSVLVIEVIGRRSGQIRRTPLIYARDGDRFVVCAANAGADRHPNWWLNLRHSGTGVAHVEGASIPVTAREAGGAERDRLADLLAEAYPPIRRYSVYTPREFPYVVLEPIPAPPRFHRT